MVSIGPNLKQFQKLDDSPQRRGKKMQIKNIRHKTIQTEGEEGEGLDFLIQRRECEW